MPSLSYRLKISIILVLITAVFSSKIEIIITPLSDYHIKYRQLGPFNYIRPSGIGLLKPENDQIYYEQTPEPVDHPVLNYSLSHLPASPTADTTCSKSTESTRSAQLSPENSSLQPFHSDKLKRTRNWDIHLGSPSSHSDIFSWSDSLISVSGVIKKFSNYHLQYLIFPYEYSNLRLIQIGFNKAITSNILIKKSKLHTFFKQFIFNNFE